MSSGGYQAGEVVLLSFPFADASGARRRPALVLVDTGDEDVVVARVTSQPLRSIFDVEIIDWQRAGLLLPSVVRLAKVATLEKRLVERRLGRLATDDWVRVRTAVQRLWASI